MIVLMIIVYMYIYVCYVSMYVLLIDHDRLVCFLYWMEQQQQQHHNKQTRMISKCVCVYRVFDCTVTQHLIHQVRTVSILVPHTVSTAVSKDVHV